MQDIRSYERRDSMSSDEESVLQFLLLTRQKKDKGTIEQISAGTGLSEAAVRDVLSCWLKWSVDGAPGNTGDPPKLRRPR